MTSSAHSLASVLSSLAQTLESSEGRIGRVQQAIRLLGKLVPYERCAMLSVPASGEPELVVLPDTTPEERAALQQRLGELLSLVSERPAPPNTGLPPPPIALSHLSVPLIGLDDVVGLLFVEHSAPDVYDVQSLEILAVVGSQLGNYLTLARLLAEQQRVNEELQRTSSFQELLVGIVGHDLRNPLSAITMAANLLQRRAVDERMATTLGRIITSANLGRPASRRNLLDLTRVRLGSGIPIVRQRVELTELLQEALSESRLTHPERTLELGALPREPLWAEVDADRLAQVLGNLLSNAATYSPPGTPVRMSLEANADGFQVDVHNEGPPIPRACCSASSIRSSAATAPTGRAWAWAVHRPGPGESPWRPGRGAQPGEPGDHVPDPPALAGPGSRPPRPGARIQARLEAMESGPERHHSLLTKFHWRSGSPCCHWCCCCRATWCRPARPVARGPGARGARPGAGGLRHPRGLRGAHPLRGAVRARGPPAGRGAAGRAALGAQRVLLDQRPGHAAGDDPSCPRASVRT